MFVTLTIIVFWLLVAIGLMVSAVSPDGLDWVPEPLLHFAAAILVVAVLFVMAACLRHLFSGKYSGSHRWLWLVLIFAGHIVGSTAYHLIVRRRKGPENESAALPS